MFKTEIYCLIRQFALQNVQKWVDVDDNVQQLLWTSFKITFNLPENVNSYVMKQVGKQFRSGHHRLHKKYKADEGCPLDIEEDQWNC